MNSTAIRQAFLDFFKEKEHEIVASAPMVNKDDPTLMFINAGMNQFKDYFLGFKKPTSPRISDTQKCLRVSGKHNDLEEVGRDSYHHTMFEMLGNWSFGDYFKQEAIEWAWEFLIDVLKLDKDRFYVSVFEGDDNDGLAADDESRAIWRKCLPDDRILDFDKKDNFWEMGETGPCGPCSEIHIDLRSDEERAKISGRDLVNADHPQVVEIWNLVFIQYNRKENGQLEALPAKHVDTGMGFERLCMAMQGTTSNYDTDVFKAYIDKLSADSGIKYTSGYKDTDYTDIAMRVIADHLRAVSFAIADGATPSNTGSGYVIRRILRRAIRYYYSYLNIKTPYIYTLVPLATEYYKDIFPELKAQEAFISTIIEEEEKAFLRTLSKGLEKLNKLSVDNNVIDGKVAFELYDTYGFPIDLTRLIGEEKGWTVDEAAFEKALAEQKNRSKSDATMSFGDWTEIEGAELPKFVGYDLDAVEAVKITRYRKVKGKKATFHITLDKTPFYAKGGGQIGDTGLLIGDEKIKILDTFRENELIIHEVDKIPANATATFRAQINVPKRRLTENNHSATHLLHAALKTVLGDHVNQKGSLVNNKYLRFDFSHFKKMTDEELVQVEQLVNAKIRENISLGEARSIPIDEAKEAGAMMLFGEKYGDQVRMITFDPNYSIELCGGCHVPATGKIGLLKITQETAVATGIRRIEAITADAAEDFVRTISNDLSSVRAIVKQKNAVKAVQQLVDDNKALKKEIEQLKSKLSGDIKGDLQAEMKSAESFKYIFKVLDNIDSKTMKDLIFQLENEFGPAVIGLGAKADGKANIMLNISKSLLTDKEWNAGQLIREAAKHINGGGGGQAFFASAGGGNAAGLDEAINYLKTQIVG